MKRKFLSFLMLGALVVASTSLTSCKDYDDDIQGLKNDVSRIEKALNDAKADLQGQIATLRSRIEAAEGEIAANKTAIANLRTDVNKNATAIADLQEKVKVNTGKISALEARMDAAENTLKELNGLITDLQNNKVDKTEFNEKIAEIYGKLESVETDLGKALTAIEGLKEGLQNEIAAREAAVADLQEQLNAVKKFEARIKAIEDDYLKQADKTELEGKINTVKTELTTAINKAKEELTTAINKAKSEAIADSKTYTDQEIAKLREQLEALSSKVNDLQAEVNVLNVLAASLRSLVFCPKFYYEGIEAFDFATYTFDKWTVKAVNADGDFTNDAPTKGAKVTFAPDLAATYFLNPSNAKMSDDKANYKFVGYNKNYVTSRAGEDAINKAFEITSADLATKGQVTVHAKYNGNVVKDIATDKQVTILALQYSQGDTIITSDFAAIKANAYGGLKLNHLVKDAVVTPAPAAAPAKTATVPRPLKATAKEAIDSEPMDSVVWNDEDGINLREIINTYRDGDNGFQAWDENAADMESDLALAGFIYEFQLVGYVVGTNKTSQSAHAAIKDDFLRAQMTKDGKQQPWGYTQNQATIGRMPLVRVLLKKDGVIADVGYLKLKIVASKEEPVQPEAESYVIPEFKDNYVLTCGDGNVLNKTLKWHEIEEPIYAHEKISLSKEDFEKYYALDKDGDVAKQFAEAVIGAKQLTDPIGVIKQTTADVDGHMTEVLSWTMKNQQAYTLLKDSEEGKGAKEPIVTYIRFVKKDGAPSDKPAEFYVKFTWNPTKVNTHPTAKFNDGSKIQQFWYANNNATAGTGNENIHGNVTPVGTGSVYAFIVPITNTLVGNKLRVDNLPSPYTNLNSNMKVRAYFMDGNNLYANADGTQLHSVVKNKQTAATLIATIDPETGLVTYANTDAAKKLLNKVAHTDLANSVTAKIYVKAIACEGEGNYEIPVENKSFDLKFLRPITISSATAKFTDAETAGSEHEVQMTFVDWRNHDFTAAKDAAARKGYNYFEFYAVSKIFVDTESDEATTNINGKEAKLKDITTELKLTYTEPSADDIKAGKFGTLKYENSNNTLGNFWIKFPVTVTYAWGEVKTTLTCTFEKTIANAKRN